MSSDDEDYSSVDPKTHQQLLSEINNIVKFQHIKKPTRTEPAIKNSEFHLVKTKPSYGSDDDIASEKKDHKVSVANVVDVVRKNTKQKQVGKQLKEVFKNDRVLPKPLEKIYTDRIQRNVAYSNTKTQLGRWDAIVSSNKAAEQLKFPLDNSKTNFHNKSKGSEVQQFRYKNKLMQDIEDIRNECFPRVEKDGEVEPPVEILTLKELNKRRKEIARLKMRESNEIIKKRMQGKIKSKKYHKLKKRDEMKKKIKEFEELKTTNPELALKELEKIEKQRVKERTTLRHKNTGTWAKNQKIRAKYDDNVKKDLEAQLAIGRELTQKQENFDSSDSDGEGETVLVPTTEENPWINGKKNLDDVDEAFSGYKKFWENHNKNMASKNDEEVEDNESENDEKNDEDESVGEEEEHSEIAEEEENPSESQSENENENLEELFDDAEDNVNDRMDSKLKQIRPQLLADIEKIEKKKKKKVSEKRKANPKDSNYLDFAKKTRLGDIDEGLIEGDDLEINEKISKKRSKLLLSEVEKLKARKEIKFKNDINPNTFMNVKSKHLITAIPKTQDFDDVDDEDQIDKISKANKMSLAEAFENDDIVNDFEKEFEENEASKNIKISNKLPGWGQWGGFGVVEKTPKKWNAKAEKKKHNRIIVSTKVNEKLQKHLISKVPFPFKSIQDFQASMRMPIGSEFIPSSAHDKLTITKIKTKAGTVIEPMSEDVLLDEGDMPAKRRQFQKKNGKKNKFRKVKS